MCQTTRLWFIKLVLWEFCLLLEYPNSFRGNYVKLERHHRSAVTGPPESFNTLRTNPKLYIPSTLNIDLILWHTQLILCAITFKSCFFFVSFFKLIPCPIHCICVSLFEFHIWILKPFLAMPKTARSAMTHKSISFIWIVWSTLYVYLWTNPHKFLSNKLILYSSHRADNGSSHSFVPTIFFFLPVALCQAHVNWHFIWIWFTQDCN